MRYFKYTNLKGQSQLIVAGNMTLEEFIKLMNQNNPRYSKIEEVIL